jgi:serine/threonine protein kinase
VRDENGESIYVVKDKKNSELFMMKSMKIGAEENKKICEEGIKQWKEIQKECDEIIKYTDHWYSSDSIFILMEYIDGMKLLSSKIIRTKSLSQKFTPKVSHFLILQLFF